MVIQTDVNYKFDWTGLRVNNYLFDHVTSRLVVCYSIAERCNTVHANQVVKWLKE